MQLLRIKFPQEDTSLFFIPFSLRKKCTSSEMNNTHQEKKVSINPQMANSINEVLQSVWSVNEHWLSMAVKK